MPSRFINAKQDANHSVIYTDVTGRRSRFSGGTWTWRNHNPGNLRTGSASRRYNQIGKAGGFAVFPGYETGFQAQIYLLRVHYSNYSINSLTKAYAPPKENNTAAYARFLHQKTGVKGNKKIKDFTAAEFKKLWQAIIKMEGYKKGKITEIHRITHVKRNKTFIDTYYVANIGWLSKEACIRLARKDLVDAVVCTSSLGNLYLRSRPDNSLDDNFSHMVVA